MALTDIRTSRPLQIGLATAIAALAALAYALSPASAPSLERMIGQMLMVGFPGSNAQAKFPRALATDVEAGRVGGVVFLGYNFKTAEEVKALTALFREAGGPTPVFVAVDMEGGAVQRLGAKLGFEKIPAAQTIAETMTPDEARVPFGKLAEMTRDSGFNVNLAPVVDLLVEPANPVVGVHRRTFGSDPQKVAAYASAFIEEHDARKVLTVIKHFPGHGSSLTDSHSGFVDISKTWKEEELEPYRLLIGKGEAHAVMPGHLFHETLAEDGLPVSLSKPAIDGVLRGKLGFSGLVMSDDLQMAAIREHYGYEDALVHAVNAGVDVLMVTNSASPDPELPARTVAIIAKAVQDGRIDRARITDAYRRIMRAKKGIAR